MGRKKVKRKKETEKTSTSAPGFSLGFDQNGMESGDSKSKAAEIATDTSSSSVDKILDKAEHLIDEFNFELAQKFCQRALEQEPDNIRALETSSTLLLEIGDTESAKHCLGRAVEICPDKGFSKYMNLGQLMTGATAVQCYQKGIELMVKEKAAKESEEVAAACSNEMPITDKDISSGYCAIAEIYLTDCCFDDSAEEKCKEFVEKALSADGDNVEALQMRANFLLSKDKKEEAKETIKKSVQLWLPKFEEADKGNVLESEFDPIEPCTVSFGTRQQSAKILIEVEEYEMAVDVLETLLDEDDEVPDVWYMIGWANFLQGNEFYNNARHYLEKAKEISQKVKHHDKQMLEHVNELLKQIGPEKPEQDENGDGFPTETDSSEEEDMDQ